MAQLRPRPKWVLREIEDEDAVRQIQTELNDLPRALARSLVARGVDTFEKAHRFFRPSREHLHDPFLMAGMEEASHRVAHAIGDGEKVTVYGDYDVDGTTGAALMVRFLRDRGVSVSYYIPHRYREGYGLNREAIDRIADDGTDLLIAIDCGITAQEEAAYCRKRGVDLIICDHHTVGDSLPPAVAVLDPKRPDCSYPFEALSGCGVAFKLSQAVLDQKGGEPADAFRYADLLALSIASDIVPVVGENRTLLREGIRVLREQAPVGIQALADAAGVDLSRCTSRTLVYQLGPRINAAGRMDRAAQAVELFLSEDKEEARERAGHLDGLNRERRQLDSDILEAAIVQAERQIEEGYDEGLVLYEPEWHLGVVGIVASRLVDQFYRPFILLCGEGEMVKGSARSVKGFNIYDAIDECSDLLLQYGGHDYAAGMTLHEDNVPVLRERFHEIVTRDMPAEARIPTIEVDARLRLSEISPRFWSVLRQFGPFGPSNTQPVFLGENLEVVQEPRIVGSDHLKFSVRDADEPSGRSFEVIGFGLGDELSTVQTSAENGTALQLLFVLEENEWNGNRTLQLQAKDIRLQSS